MRVARAGLDTGFFLALSQGDPFALDVFQGPADLAVSALALYELNRKLRESGNPRWREMLADLMRAVFVAPVTAEAALRAGDLAVEFGLPSGAALILATFMEAGCRTVYTTDRRLARAAPPGIEIIVLNPGEGPETENDG